MAALSQQLRIASWNVHEVLPVTGRDSESAVLAQVIELVTDLDIDIMGLQEVDFFDGSSSRVLAAIERHTALKYITCNVLSDSSFRQGEQAGVAIASRFPLMTTARRLFKNPGLRAGAGEDAIAMHDKGLVAACVRVGAQNIGVVSLHSFPFHLFGRDAEDPEFQSSWASMSHILREFSAQAMIVCGDFNTARRDLLLDYSGLSLTRAIENYKTHKGEAMDDILFSQNFTAEISSVYSTFSDHALCIADLVPDGSLIGARSNS